MANTDPNYEATCGAESIDLLAWEAENEACAAGCEEAAGGYPGIEYEVVGLFVGNII